MSKGFTSGEPGDVLTRVGEREDEYRFKTPQLINLSDHGLYGEGYVESHKTSGGGDVVWGLSDTGLYNSDFQIVELTDDGGMEIVHDGLYEIRLQLYGYGNGSSGSNFASASIWGAAEPYDIVLNQAHVDLSGITGQVISNAGVPIKSIAPFKQGEIVRTNISHTWTVGSVPSGINFELDLIIRPLFLISH
jgi:hypothetical protein